MLSVDSLPLGGENGVMVRKFSKHTPEQIVRKLDKARELRESGSTTAQILTELGISDAPLNRW